jgi:hypothetical protein
VETNGVAMYAAETREEIDKLCQVIDKLRRYWAPTHCVNLGGFTNGAKWFLETLSELAFAQTWKPRRPSKRLWKAEVRPLLIEQMARIAKLVDEIDVDPESTQAALPGVDLCELREALVEALIDGGKTLYFEDQA